MLHTKVDVKCDKLAKVVGRSSQILSTYFDQQTDHQFIAQSVELCQIKLTALCDDQCAAAKFSQYRVFMGQSLRGKLPLPEFPSNNPL